MASRGLLVVMCLGLLGVAAPEVQGAECTRWVAEDGSDQATGTSGAPWATLQHAVDAAVAGDVVCVEAGTYVEDEVVVGASGSVAKPITLRADDDADVTLQGAIGFDQGVSHWVLEGLAVTGFDVWGVTVLGDNEDIVLRELDVSGGEAAIHLTVGASGDDPVFGPVEDVVIESCTLSDVVYTALDCTPGPCDELTIRDVEVSGAGVEAGFAGDGIAVERGEHVVVEDCHVHDNGGDGIDIGSRDLGSDMPGIVVRRNRVGRNLHNGIKVWAGGRIENNLVWRCGDTLLVLEGGTYTVVNNTFASLDGYSYMAVLGNYDAEHDATVLLENNIFFNDDADMGGTLVLVPARTTLDADYNLYFNPYRTEDVICSDAVLGGACFSGEEIDDGTFFVASGQGEHSVYADPLFLSASGDDFRLTSESPAVDAGSMTHAPSDDLAGDPRDASPDLGAYELGGTGGCQVGCSASAPAVAITGTPVSFDATTTTSGCSGQPSFAWDFGDGSGSTLEDPQHTYDTVGSYSWSLEVRVGGSSCSRSGTVTVTDSQPCSADASTLCLNASRFAVTVSWETQDGRSGDGTAVPMTADTGLFWFFRSTNLELMVKVLDGRALNGHYWVFYGALSDVDYEITVTDTTTGAVRTYHNPQGQMASFADVRAFAAR